MCKVALSYEPEIASFDAKSLNLFQVCALKFIKLVVQKKKKKKLKLQAK